MVRSELITVDVKRSDGVIGRYVFIGISSSRVGPEILVSSSGVACKTVLWIGVVRALYRLLMYSGIFSPAFNRTYAFFQSERKPLNLPRFRSLPTKFAVRTA